MIAGLSGKENVIFIYKDKSSTDSKKPFYPFLSGCPSLRLSIEHFPVQRDQRKLPQGSLVHSPGCTKIPTYPCVRSAQSVFLHRSEAKPAPDSLLLLTVVVCLLTLRRNNTSVTFPK